MARPALVLDPLLPPQQWHWLSLSNVSLLNSRATACMTLHMTWAPGSVSTVPGSRVSGPRVNQAQGIAGLSLSRRCFLPCLLSRAVVHWSHLVNSLFSRPGVAQLQATTHCTSKLAEANFNTTLSTTLACAVHRRAPCSGRDHHARSLLLHLLLLLLFVYACCAMASSNH
jgi:hypothetical protein